MNQSNKIALHLKLPNELLRAGEVILEVKISALENDQFDCDYRG
jgi:hypothetical protein